ncbi:hypothetical protein A2272_02635 [Candidatus Peregrinibacteria bacterium RIFOXYA12_FULL_33_12]|nr:MAG: hypothetical protein A2263_06235 [Candidatus Peregrinibacteria bacterium RIFOXYA2_FULL_33_21]OGJ47389.1 MAG: hypothetical protein A2272_02635 [Candidatus Peregrinibacteria bacterium RIFOXYA12_FULL_33_12]OGJ50492.1 MAG: hypothetical protein A2307_02860 [Candidatus Peregrinibacteria bacterium RIFOXYB2_FULL_33_20]
MTKVRKYLIVVKIMGKIKILSSYLNIMSIDRIQHLDVKSLSSQEIHDLLVMDYHAFMREQYPFQIEPGKCASIEEGYVMGLHVDAMQIPSELSFDAVVANIVGSERQGMQNFWSLLKSFEKKFQDEAERFVELWDEDSRALIPSQEALALIEKFSSFIKGTDINTLALLISQKSGDRKVEKWQSDEAAHRNQFYTVSQNIMKAVKAWYKRLIFRPFSLGSQYIAPIQEDNSLYSEALYRARAMDFIDSLHMGVVVGRGFHHPQSSVKDKLRETGEGFFRHPIQTAYDFAYHVLRHTINDVVPKCDPRDGGRIGCLHDACENTIFGVYALSHEFSERANRVDTKLSNALLISFGVPVSILRDTSWEVLTDWLHVAPGRSARIDMERASIVMTNKCEAEFGEEEKREIISAAKVLGKDIILKYFPITEEEIDDTDPDRIIPRECSLNFMKIFSSIASRKILPMIAKLVSFTQGEQRRAVLREKLLDRINNFLTIGVKSPEKQLIILRETFLLAAYVAVDWDHETLELLDPFPKLLDMLYDNYIKWKGISPGGADDTISLDQNDLESIEYLEQWKEQFPYYEKRGEVIV